MDDAIDGRRTALYSVQPACACIGSRLPFPLTSVSSGLSGHIFPDLHEPIPALQYLSARIHPALRLSRVEMNADRPRPVTGFACGIFKDAFMRE